MQGANLTVYPKGLTVLQGAVANTAICNQSSIPVQMNAFRRVDTEEAGPQIDRPCQIDRQKKHVVS